MLFRSCVISAGGSWGQGLGDIQRSNAIPEVQADFIFAGWAEAMGLIGVVLYFILLAFFACRAFSIAFKLEALKGGFELKKDKRRRQAKSLEEELRKNNFVVFKASTALVTFSFAIIFFVLLMGTGLHIEQQRDRKSVV